MSDPLIRELSRRARYLANRDGRRFTSSFGIPGIEYIIDEIFVTIEPGGEMRIETNTRFPNLVYKERRDGKCSTVAVGDRMLRLAIRALKTHMVLEDIADA